MIEQKAQVVAIDNASVWVEAKREASCSRCAANKGCGNAVLHKLFGNKDNVMPVSNEVDVNIGDSVIIGIEENTLVKNSVAVYAAPILLIVIFAALGETLLTSTLSINKDLASIVGAVTGFIVSVIGLRWFNRKAANGNSHKPVLLRRIESEFGQSDIKILS